MLYTWDKIDRLYFKSQGERIGWNNIDDFVDTVVKEVYTKQNREIESVQQPKTKTKEDNDKNRNYNIDRIKLKEKLLH